MCLFYLYLLVTVMTEGQRMKKLTVLFWCVLRDILASTSEYHPYASTAILRAMAEPFKLQ